MTPHRILRRAPLAVVALLAACASTPAPTPPSVTVPEALRAPASEVLQRTLWADGVQIYECRPMASDADAAQWVFVAPEATLVDGDGALVGRHYAGPTWEAADGSKVVGAVKAKMDAPDAGAIPWELLTTHSTGTPGLFANVTSIQRVATAGGAMPGSGCSPASVGQVARVAYKAQYTQYAVKQP
jgi:hypothetical protein